MGEPKNICITINSLSSGGAEKQCLLLAKALKPYHNVILVILKPEPVYQPHLTVITKEDIEHRYLSSNPIKRMVEFTSFLRKKKIDIIFSFLPTDTSFSAICGKLAGVPHIFGGIRNSYIPKMKFVVLRTVHNYLLSYTIANNYAAYLSALDFGFQKKVFVISNGIEIKPFLKEPKENHKNITIISMGRLVEQKDYETAIKSIAELKKSVKPNTKLKYKIVGHGPEKESIVATIEKYGMQEEVEIISNPSNVYELLQASDIYLCTSIFEGISNSIMEAMNCRLPIVATDAGDNARLVIHNKNGFITAINDYEKLSSHMQHLIESPEIRFQMGSESYNHLNQSFGFAVFQKKYLDIIKNVADIKTHKGEYRIQE